MTSCRVQDWASASVRPLPTAVTGISGSHQRVKDMVPPSGCGFHVRSAVVSTKGVSSNKSSNTSCLGGRMSDYRNHSKNSLRSNSFSCRFTCVAYATQESKKIPIIVHPINASSCGMFFDLDCAPLLPYFVPHVFSDKSSKTFRTRRSLEECKSFESVLSL